MTGHLARYNEKGFGFIKPDDSYSPNLFVHIRDLRRAGATDPPRIGQRFEFDVTEEPRGLRASNLIALD